MIKIEELEYWTGAHCLECEVPWQTPQSIYLLDRICKSSDTVLEIGTGGSTLFYARRCASVIAIETNEVWFNIVNQILMQRNIVNVTYLLIKEQEKIESFLKNIEDTSIVSVDSVHGYNRSSFLDIILERNKSFSTLVLDNYAAKELFPTHFDKSLQQMIELLPPGQWIGEDFDDVRWTGNGTRILRKGV